MENENVQNTLKKMGLVLEKLVKKIDELDKRLTQIEKEKDLNSGETKTQAHSSSSGINSIGSNFLGSLTGAMAGMGLYNLLFNHNVTPVEMGEGLGMNTDEINEVLENNLEEVENKLDEIDSKLEEMDSKLEDITEDEDIMSNEYYENYEDEVQDNDFESGYSDFDGLDI